MFEVRRTDLERRAVDDWVEGRDVAVIKRKEEAESGWCRKEENNVYMRVYGLLFFRDGTSVVRVDRAKRIGYTDRGRWTLAHDNTASVCELPSGWVGNSREMGLRDWCALGSSELIC